MKAVRIVTCMNADDMTPIDLASTADFSLGQARVRPSSREIEGKGRTLMLEPRVMQVLVALSRQRKSSVTRYTLTARCWGGAVVGDDAFQRCISRLR